MKDVIKLTSVAGETIYLRDSYNVFAVCCQTEGELKYTMVCLHGVVFRVKQTAEEVATLLGWEPKRIGCADEPRS